MTELQVMLENMISQKFDKGFKIRLLLIGQAPDTFLGNNHSIV